MPQGDLTANFSFSEFFVSKDFPDLAKAAQVEVFADEKKFTLVKAKAFYLSQFYLERIRVIEDGPVQILSGYRSEELNKAVEGEKKSHHRFEDEEAAVDFTCSKIAVIASHLAKYKYELRYGQMIWYPERNFIHISLPSRNRLCEALVKEDGRFRNFV